MKAVIEEVAREYPVELEEVDVDEDPALRERYGMDVPVLLIDGRKAFKYRVDPVSLRRRLAGAGSTGRDERRGGKGDQGDRGRLI